MWSLTSRSHLSDVIARLMSRATSHTEDSREQASAIPLSQFSTLGFGSSVLVSDAE
jgi:hypothetical protein